MTPANTRTAAAFAVTMLLHAAVLTVAMLVRLPDPPRDRGPIELHLIRKSPPARRSMPPASASRMPVQTATVPRPSTSPSAPTARVPAESNDAAVDGAREVQQATGSDDPIKVVQAADSTAHRLPARWRSVLERPVSAEEAWSILGRLMDEYPQYRETVLKEMIAGSGLPADSLPRIDLRYDQIFRTGIPPSWDAQRHVIEDAFKSFDAVHGWTNKGGYGPTINIIGLVRFLIDLIEGE